MLLRKILQKQGELEDRALTLISAAHRERQGGGGGRKATWDVENEYQMADINPTVPIITLTVSELNMQ